MIDNKDKAATNPPPSYDVATSDIAPSSSTSSPDARGYTLYAQSDVKAPPPLYPEADSKAPEPSPFLEPRASSYAIAGPSSRPASRVYHYQNPRTGQSISTLLPPDHPEMICLQEGQHIQKTRFGLLGIMAAVLWFPLGIGICLLDRKVTCKRCGHVVSDSMCY